MGQMWPKHSQLKRCSSGTDLPPRPCCRLCLHSLSLTISVFAHARLFILSHLFSFHLFAKEKYPLKPKVHLWCVVQLGDGAKAAGQQQEGDFYEWILTYTL